MIGIGLFLLLAGQAPMSPVPVHDTSKNAQQPPPVVYNFEMRDLTEEEAAVLVAGEGRDAVAFMCVPCHGVLRAVSLPKTELAWAATVEDMRVKGAKGTDEQAEAAVKYLAAHFAAVNVNTATVEALVAIAELSPEDAAAIVAFRGEGRPFKSFTDMKKVPGVDPKRLAAAKPRLAYTPK